MQDDMSSALDALPLFATDAEIAAAIVGKTRSRTWLKERFPTIATLPGFPPIDDFHGGRPTWRVRDFYRDYLAQTSPPRGEARPEMWKRKKRP
jgi:hypothetical protein